MATRAATGDPTHRTARERARAEIEAEILAEARRQLAEHGAAALSLRSIARALGMVSSGIYRYVASRDELLTRLIVAGYDSLGDAVDQSAATTADAPPAERWVHAAHTVRDWALAHPHEYSLLYGSPVPGYAAPETTIVPGTRASLALLRIVAEAQQAGRLHPPAPADDVVGPELAADFARLRDVDAMQDGELRLLDLPDAQILDVLIAWTQLFGLLGFELTGQTRGVVEEHRPLFDAAARRQAGHLGLARDA